MLIAGIVTVRGKEGKSQGDVRPSAGGKTVDGANDALIYLYLTGEIGQMDPGLVWS